MTRTFHVLLTVCVLLAQRGAAATSISAPVLGLRTPLSNALAAATASSTPDAKLVSGLNKALGLIDHVSDSNLAANVAVLSQISSAVLRTSASNEIGAPLQGAVDAYISLLVIGVGYESNRLAGCFPSGTRTAAARNLDLLSATLRDADAATSLASALKGLMKAVPKFKVAAGLVAKAASVPPPPANITATVSISGAPPLAGFNFKSKGAGITPGFTGNFGLLAGTTVGRGLSSELQSVFFGVSGLVPGANSDVPVNGGGCTITSAKRHAGFVGGTGTAQVTWNPDTGSLFGTFSFVAHEDGNGPHTATINGSFSGTYPH